MAPWRVKRNFAELGPIVAIRTTLHTAPVQSFKSPDPGTSLPAVLRVHPDLVPGTEPAVVEGSATGVLLLHGYTGSPWEVRPLVPVVQQLGWTCALPVLAGHGTSVDDLEQTSWHDWLGSASTATRWLEKRCQRIHIVGLSMGGLLALSLLKRQFSVPFASCTLLAPALTLGPVRENALLLAATTGWPKRVGKEPPALARGLLPPAYWQIPVKPTVSLIELAKFVADSGPYPPIPTSVLHGNLDRTIPMTRTRKIVRTLLPHAEHHVIAGAGHLLPRTWQARKVLALVKEALRHGEAVSARQA